MCSRRSLYPIVLAFILAAAVPASASGFWTPPVYHPELNADGYPAEAPCLSSDGLTIYFGRHVPTLGAKAIFQATRADLDSAFGPQTMITELFHGVNMNAPWISLDGLRLYYHEVMLPDERAYIRMAVRSDVTQPWTVARTFTEIHAVGMTDCSPALSADELILVYQLETGIASDPRYICIATRNSVDEPFGAPSRVIELGAGVSSGPFLSPDGLQLYCTRYVVSGNSGDIVVATRASRAEPFSAPVAFAPFNKAGLSEGNVAFTEDMRQICYNGTYVVSPYTEGIYTSYLYEPQIGYELLDGNYTAEIVAAYRASKGKLGVAWGMCFDPAGNLYLAHEGDYSVNTDGAIYRVSPEGQASMFVSGLGNPVQIVWGGGTPYGEYLYVTDGSAPPKGKIWRITLGGTRTTFCEPSNWPVPITIDRAGTYGGLMYAATSSYKKILSVSPSGAMNTFSTFVDGDEGIGVFGIAIAEPGPYGGLMYVLTDVRNPAHQGLYTLDAMGNPTLLTPGFVFGGMLGFDRTPQQFFGGGLFARAVLAGDEGQYRSIFYVSPTGEVVRFLRKASAESGIASFTFGPDGAMYVAEYNSKYDTAVISRILPAGPYLAALNNLRLASAAKTRAIADVGTAVASEKLAIIALGELIRKPGADIMTRRAILTAAQKVAVAKAQEDVALMLLRKSLPLINEAQEILIEQIAPDAELPVGPVRWPPVQSKPGR